MEKKKRDDDDAIPRPRPSPLSPLSRLSRPRRVLRAARPLAVASLAGVWHRCSNPTPDRAFPGTRAGRWRGSGVIRIGRVPRP